MASKGLIEAVGSPGAWRRGSAFGYSLVELLVVLAILLVVAAVGTTVVSRVIVSANLAKCLSNQRQIGLAILHYANDHEGELPPTTHTTGGFRRDRAWIFTLDAYLDQIDEVRICPADPPKRKKRIRQMRATSYVLNDLVFDDYQFNNLRRLPLPSRTLLLAILSENRAPSTTRDHIHGGEWTTWMAALGDIEPDRHRVGRRSSDRLKGSANYLYADGHARNLSAAGFREIIERGINPASVPTF